MLEQPIQAPNIIQSKSQIKSQKTQNTLRHRYWLMLQCQFWIYHLFITGLSLYLIYQFIKIDVQANSVYSTEQYRYGQQAIDFWKKGYIIDIKQVNTDNCPQGYTEVINYVWPGTYDGCACRTIVNSHASQYIMTGACTSELISYGCTTISAVSKKIMKMWKGGKLLCYKRIKSLNFYNSTLATTPDGTNTPMKKCAVNQSYQVTTLPDITCPQTVISNTSVGTSTQTVLNLDQLNSYNLYYQNQQSYPIVDFKLTEYKFCTFFNQTNISPDKNGNYILEVMNISETCNGTDPRVIEFDYMTEQAFYTNNTRIYALLSGLPGYPRPSISQYYKLGFYRYPAWTTSCRNSQTHNLLITTQHLNFTHITQKTKLILYVGIPCMILISILIRILYIIRHIFQLKSKKQYNMLILTDQEVGQQIPNLNIIKSFKKQVFFCIFQLLLLVGTIFILAFSAYQFINESIWIKQSYNKKCTQQHLNWIFRHNQQKVDTCNYLTGLSIMFTIVIFIVEIIHFVIRNKFGDLKQIEIKVQQSQSNEGLIKDDLDEKKNNMVADQNINLQDSSDIILRKQKQQLKIYDLDNFMSIQLQGNNAGETGYNFYAQQSVEIQNYQLGKKKKKKGIKRKNLFKQGQQK